MGNGLLREITNFASKYKKHIYEADIIYFYHPAGACILRKH